MSAPEAATATVYRPRRAVALVVAVGLGLYQQYLIRERDPAACFRAFLNNNWLGMVVFAGLVMSYD